MSTPSPGLVLRQAWAVDHCTPLPSDGTTYSTSVSTDESTVYPYLMQPWSRMEHLSTLFVSIIDDTVPTNDDAGQDYASEVINNFLIAPFGLLGLILVCLIPCYICRCCAHKGPCRPRKEAYGKRHKALTGVCCFIFFVLTLAMTALAALNMLNLTPGMQRTMCGVANIFNNITTSLNRMDTRLTAIDAALTSVNSQLSPIRTNLNSISNGFVAGAGDISVACTELTTAQTSLASIVSTAQSAGVSNLGTTFTSLQTGVTSARTLACTTLPSYSGATTSALSGVQLVNSAVSSVSSGGTDSISTFSTECNRRGGRSRDSPIA